MFETLEIRTLLAANLLADFGGIYPTETVDVDGVSYFAADDGVHGKELWKSDGTLAGTVLVKDVTRGGGSSRILQLTEFAGGVAFFIRGSDQNVTLWKSNGTKAGTVMIVDVPDDTIQNTLTVLNGKLLFISGNTSDYPEPGGKLWASDGTNAGTMVIREMPEDDYVFDLKLRGVWHVAGHVVFGTYHRMWRTDGTADGTVQLDDGNIPEGEFWHEVVGALHDGGDVLYWTVGQQSTPRLWKTDGTIEGTAELASGIFPSQIGIVAGNKVYFQVQKFVWDDEVSGHAVNYLWQSDGTVAGTKQVGVLPNFLTIDWVAGFGDKLIFGDRWLPEVHPGEPQPDPITHNVWAFDGKTGQFTLLHACDFDTPPNNFVSVGNMAFFVVHVDGDSQVWRTDGTVAGTQTVRTVSTQEFVRIDAFNGRLAIVTWQQTILVNPEQPNVAVEPNTSKITQLAGILRIFGTKHSDSIRIYQHQQYPDRFVVDLNGVKRSYAFSAVSRIYIYGYSGDDSVAIVEKYGKFAVRSRIWGGGGNDIIYTGGARDTLYGESGDDTIGSGNNDDQLAGGDGEDSMWAGNGNDTSTGGDGADTIQGNKGDDVVAGGEDDSEDLIDGGSGADVLFGGSVFEIFFGGVQGEDPSGLDEILIM